jgi:GNAT superfamily N-acetyltransferase
MISVESEISEMNLREAFIGDISVLAKHHRNMFEEIWTQKGEPISTVKAQEIEKAYTQKLELEMGEGICKAWVIESKGEIVSSGAITFVSFVPTPYDLSSKIAYLHSIFTEKSYRNKKCAQRVIHAAIKYCSDQGVNRMILTASNAGKTIYEKIGFHSTPEMMRLLIDKNT